jgi:hypothetical protein
MTSEGEPPAGCLRAELVGPLPDRFCTWQNNYPTEALKDSSLGAYLMVYVGRDRASMITCSIGSTKTSNRKAGGSRTESIGDAHRM